MSNVNIDHPNKAPQGKVIAGAVLLLVGIVLLLKQFDIFIIPDNLRLWPFWLIFWGLYVGSRHNFQKSSWAILLGLGIIFLLTENLHNIEGFVWPAAIIGLGLWIITKRNRSSHLADNTANADYWDKKYRTDPLQAGNTADAGTVDTDYTTVPPAEQVGGNTPPPYNADDYLNVTAIFGNVNKTIMSKNFHGGDITCVFGGTELDFTRADINGRVIIDITQLFGATKIIVPANWHVVTDVSAVFAGVDDKRIKNSQAYNTDKILVLKGTSILAGVDIRSY